VREKLQKEKMQNRAGRALGFEKRLRGRGGSMWAQWCQKEMRERAIREKDLSKWKKERRQFFEKRKMVPKIWEVQRMEEKSNLAMLEKREEQKK